MNHGTGLDKTCTKLKKKLNKKNGNRICDIYDGVRNV